MPASSQEHRGALVDVAGLLRPRMKHRSSSGMCSIIIMLQRLRTCLAHVQSLAYCDLSSLIAGLRTVCPARVSDGRGVVQAWVTQNVTFLRSVSGMGPGDSPCTLLVFPWLGEVVGASLAIG